MRRLVVPVLVAAMLATVPATTSAGRPVFTIDSITVSAAGGTAPYCQQEVTVAFTAGHRAGWVRVWAFPYPGTTEPFTFSLFREAATASGTVTITVGGVDLSAYPQWGWRAGLFDRRDRIELGYDLHAYTGPWSYGGSCPASGQIATYPR